MLLLDTNDKLQITTSQAGTLDVVVSFVEASTADPPVVKGSTMASQKTAITTATTTDICAVAAASSVRNVKTIHVRNKSATTATDVTVILLDNATGYELFKCNLDTGEMLEYIEGVGFFEIAAAPKLDTVRRVTADYVNATTSLTSITGLTFDVIAGKYYRVEADLIYQTNASTTGAQFAIGGVAMTSMILGGIQTVTGSATAAAMSAAVVTAVDTAVIVQTTGPSTTNVPGRLSGMINPSASGQLVFKGASEVAVAAGLTVKAGSWAQLREFDN
jgi:hypothetical protein